MPPHLTLSNSLRVVGQVLQQRKLDLFDLKYSDGEFFVQCASPSPPYLSLVELGCSLVEVEDLNAQARAARGAPFKPVDFESLPELLRAVGRGIEERSGQLLRLYNFDPPAVPDSITVEYRTRDRQRHVEKIFLGSLGERVLRMYRARARGSMK